MRADVYLFEKGFAQSRQKAKELIENGNVFVNGLCIKKPSYNITDETVEIKGDVMPYVSRGGLKLQEALEAFKINVIDLTAVDIGASSGGFTDCLLQHGAGKVYAIDCGTNQLDLKLRNNPKVVSIENFNARELDENIIPVKCDIAVMDVSFISQKLLFLPVTKVLKEGGFLISLIKPQFEVGRENIGKNGIVKSDKLRINTIRNIINAAYDNQLYCEGVINSPIEGGDGNKEYLALFRYKVNNNINDNLLKNL